MVKNEMSTIVSNIKFSMANFKISPDAIKGFSKLTIDNKHIKSALILQFFLGVSADKIVVFNHFFYWGI